MKKRENTKRSSGITLVALVVTIIVLIILVAVAINIAIGDNGLTNKSKEATDLYSAATAKEKVEQMLVEYEAERVSQDKSLEDFFKEQKNKNRIDEIMDNMDGTVSVFKDNYEVIIDIVKLEVVLSQDTRLIPQISNIKISLQDGTEVEDYTQGIGTALTISFDTKMQRGQIKSVTTGTLNNDEVTYTTNGTEKEVTFTIIGELDGKEVKRTKKISIANKYLISSTSLFDAISEINESGISKVQVDGKTSDGTNETIAYDINAIYYDGDLVLDGTTNVTGATLNSNVYEFGDASIDVATATTNAQNMVLLKVNGNITINSGITLTTCKSESGFGGPKGMLLYCTGSLINNGTISMTARGAKAEGQNVYLYKNLSGTYELVPAVGGFGGQSITHSSSTNAADVYQNPGNRSQKARGTGGGGTGACTQYKSSATVGAGGNGTSYSGGSGSGACNISKNGASGSSQNASNVGGSGSDGVRGSFNGETSDGAAGGGAGNPGGMGRYGGANSSWGSQNSSYKGSNGTGGLLVIYANKIENIGNMNANGSNGGPSLSRWQYNGGGSSGGGSINIFYKEITNDDYTNVTVNGGTRVHCGGAGGLGSISIGSVKSGNYESLYKNY